MNVSDGRPASLGPEAPMADLLRRLVPKELVMLIAKAVGGHPKRLLRQAAPEMAETLIRTLKDFRIPVSDYRPFEEAIVTAGGITVSEVNPATMESKFGTGIVFRRRSARPRRQHRRLQPPDSLLHRPSGRPA